MGLIKSLLKPIENNIKGKVGEAKVNMKLNPLLFGREHRQINNLILTDENNKTHQIDHIEIRENGIFCIETKNYTGLIFGSEKQEKWTQVLYREKHQFMNPLKQNNIHIYHLNRVLKHKYHVNSLVVMAQNNAQNIECKNVVNLNDLSKYLKHYNDGTILTNEEMDSIYNLLLSSSSNVSNKDHVNNIKATQNDIKKGLCPRCGGQLVEKNGKYGKFYGCSNYPKCTFILKEKQ